MHVEVDALNRQWRSLPAVELQVRLRRHEGVWRVFLMDDSTSYAELHLMMSYLFGFDPGSQHHFFLSRRLHPDGPVLEAEETLALLRPGRHFSYLVKGERVLSFSMLVRSHGRVPQGELPVTLAGSGRLLWSEGSAEPKMERFDEVSEFNEMQRSVHYDDLMLEPREGFVQRWGFGAVRMKFDDRETYCNLFINDDADYARISNFRPLLQTEVKAPVGAAVVVRFEAARGEEGFQRSLKVWSEITFCELHLAVNESLGWEGDEGAFIIGDSLIQKVEDEVDICAYEEAIDENLIRLRDIMAGPGWQMLYRNDAFWSPQMRMVVESVGGPAPNCIELLSATGTLDVLGDVDPRELKRKESKSIEEALRRHVHRWPSGRAASAPKGA